jgi:hypothetical protein
MIIKLWLATSLWYSAADWLKLSTVSKLTNHMLEFGDRSPVLVLCSCS